MKSIHVYQHFAKWTFSCDFDSFFSGKRVVAPSSHRKKVEAAAYSSPSKELEPAFPPSYDLKPALSASYELKPALSTSNELERKLSAPYEVARPLQATYQMAASKYQLGGDSQYQLGGGDLPEPYPPDWPQIDRCLISLVDVEPKNLYSFFSGTTRPMWLH